MPKLFKKSLSLTILIVVPMIFTNKILSYLQSVEIDREPLILFGIVVCLVAIVMDIVLKRNAEKDLANG
jgi:hypothetical protein